MQQDLHPDFNTTLASTEYFFLGSGHIAAAIQWSANEKATPLGLLLWDPGHFARKWSTHLYHPEFGLERTQVTVFVDGVAYKPMHQDLRVEWEAACIEPEVKATWKAGPCQVIEIFRCPWDSNILVREVMVLQASGKSVEIELPLYANPALYNSFETTENGLRAEGYDTLEIKVLADASTNERFVKTKLDTTLDIPRIQILYSLGSNAASDDNLKSLFHAEENYWMRSSRVDAGDKSRFASTLVDLYRASAAGLRASIDDEGKFDASLFQYNFEWSGDASMCAEALVYSGQFEVARRVLVNILTRLTNNEGMAAESSRFRGGKDSELNNNGEILKACYTYHEWTGDDSLVREYFPRIKAVADYLLKPEFLEENNLLRASRDIWERNEAVGILPGYDVSHQTFAIAGLEAASKLAAVVNDEESGKRWLNASDRIRKTFLTHPTHSFIENGRLIKRRLVTGEMQYQVRVDHSKANEEFFKKFVPEGMPLSKEGYAIWEPDVSEAFPICFGLVDPTSDVAKRTMSVLESLWSQDWDGGGYGRYNVLSEPDSPGPWPFATGFMAAAYLEMGDIERATRAIEWLAQKAKSGGCWFEFYGYRPTPPLPPTGVIVWGWAQFVTLVMKHVLGATVENDTLVFRPKISGLKADVRFREIRAEHNP